MLTVLYLVLRCAPAMMALEQSTNVITRFLGPPRHLSFHEACRLGSTVLLDWIWSDSATRAADRTVEWSVSNFLRSNPHNHRWQFSRSLEVAAGRGDLPMVEWLFEHFSGCEIPATVADEAKWDGNLCVLRFLWEHRCGDKSHDAGSNVGCSVRFDPDDALWDGKTIERACENGQLTQCLDAGMHFNQLEKATAITHALRIGNLELAERLVPTGQSMFDFADYCPHTKVTEKMLEHGYCLQFDSRRAALTVRSLAHSGRLDLMQSVVQLHSPLPKRDKCWVKAWVSALKKACRHGYLSVLQWLLAHSLGNKAIQRIRNGSEFNCLLSAAAKGGHYEGLIWSRAKQFRRAMDEVLSAFTSKRQVSSIKWLLEHHSYGLDAWTNAINSTVQSGYVEILRLFHELDKPPAAGAKWCQPMDIGTGKLMCWSAEGGHLNVLKWLQENCRQEGNARTIDTAASGGRLDVIKWLHHNRPNDCTKDAIDKAAASGHLAVVKWLHSNRSEGCSDQAMILAAENGHLETVKWLYKNIPESCTVVAIDRAVECEQFHVACWLQSLFPGHKIGIVLDSEDAAESFETLLFLHDRCSYVFTPQFLENIRDVPSRETLRSYEKDENYHLICHVQAWLDEHYPNTSR